MASPIKKAIISLYLSLDKHFDQIDSKANELISLIGLITEKILHPDMCHKSLLQWPDWLFKIPKRDLKREDTIKKASKNQVIKP